MPTEPFITPNALKGKLPLSSSQQEFIEHARNEVRNCLSQRHLPLLLIIGPCSIHDLNGAEEYALRLKELADQVKDTFFIVMRSYFEKPRTLMGWKGLMHDPFLDNSHDMLKGYEKAREFLLFLADLGLPAASEFLDPLAAAYKEDLVTWGCIGARTSTSQIHRQIVSDLKMPVGFKNSTDGNVENAIHGCLTAKESHTFLKMSDQGYLFRHTSSGNPSTHVVLRGGVDQPNYDKNSLKQTKQLLNHHQLQEQIIVDCSHDNCRKKYENQTRVFEDVLKQVREGENAIRGLMLESYLESGNQPLKTPLKYGVSITDPCMSWEETKRIVLDASENLLKVIHV